MGGSPLLIDKQGGQIAPVALSPGTQVLTAVLGIIVSPGRSRGNRLALIIGARPAVGVLVDMKAMQTGLQAVEIGAEQHAMGMFFQLDTAQDRKSTRLNSSHVAISYAVFCLKKKKKY